MKNPNTTEPNVVITEADFDRLRYLVESSARDADNASLKAELHRGKVVSPNTVPRGVVTMHSRVRLRDLRLDESETYTLVYPNEVDIAEGKVSVLAPIGRALLGARVGQIVTFKAPAGERRLKVERILYQPEAAGDFHL
jgi:regulator of nucleoside diphosphate kinase